MIKRLSLTLAVSGLLLWGVFAALHVHAQPSGVQLVNDPDFNDSTAWVLDNATVDSGIVALFGAQSTVAQTLPPVFVGGDYQIEVTHRSNGRANVQRVGLYSADGRPVFEGDLLPAKEWQTAVFTAPLPGGEFEVNQLDALAARLARSFPFLGAVHSARLARAYGTRAWTLLGRARSMSDLGRQFGATLTEAEVRYLVEHEWASTAEDVLWRRTKLGLRLGAAETAALDDWMHRQAATAAEAPAR